jgi:hypothetical protein
MKIEEAKNLIIDAMSLQMETKVSPKWRIQTHLVLGVKLGKMTPKQAAEQEITDYQILCTEIFDK